MVCVCVMIFGKNVDVFEFNVVWFVDSWCFDGGGYSIVDGCFGV